MEERIEKIMDKQVFSGEIVLYFDLRDAEESWKVERLLDNFEDATVLMTKNAAAGQVILSISGKPW
jgi:hypothetical protein